MRLHLFKKANFVILFLGIFPLVTPNTYLIMVMVLVGIYAILSLGLSLLLGYAGQVSIGHAGFFAIGAYTTGILTTKIGFPTWLAFFASIGTSSLAAYLIGLPILRLKGYFLALATLGFGEIIWVVANQAEWLTNGPPGITAIPWLSIGIFQFDNYTKMYYLVWVLLLGLTLFSQNIIHSSVGRALRGISSSEVAASTIGINISSFKLQVFVLSGAYAGIAGSLFAFFLTVISPPSFTTSLSIMLIMIVIIGGTGNIYGTISGAFFITWVMEFLSRYEEYSLSAFGLLLVLLLIFMPKGIFLGIFDISRKVRQYSDEYVPRLASKFPGKNR